MLLFIKGEVRSIYLDMYLYNVITKEQSSVSSGDCSSKQLLSLAHDIHVAFHQWREVRLIYFAMHLYNVITKKINQVLDLVTVLLNNIFH